MSTTTGQPTGIFVRVPPAVKRQFARIAAENRRSMGAEAALLIEAHVKAEKEKTR